jgi:ankyrin repeat protein
MSKLTGNKDTDRLILSNVDEKELLNICSIDKYTWNIVCDDDFLRRKLSLKYPDVNKQKKDNESWKKFFLRSIHYISKLKDYYKYDYTFGDFEEQLALFISNEEDDNDISVLLLRSCSVEELALVIYCLNNKANVNYACNSPLSTSIRQNNAEIVKYLLDQGSDFDNYDFIIAIKFANLEIVKTLVEKGIDIKNDNNKALRTALEMNKLEIAKYLIEKIFNTKF